jgi:hypothetical protein
LTSILAANGLDPARRLIFSPAWERQAVIFDARSGDFWIVDSEVRDALCSASNDSVLGVESLQRLAPEVIESLTAHGIIQASRTS